MKYPSYYQYLKYQNYCKHHNKPLKYQSFYKYFLLVIAYFIAPEVFAGVFDVLPTDKSKQYLGIIFGGSVGTVSLGGSANPMLSQMFEKFNFIIVTAGVTILSYVGIISAVNTAREGEAMGKKFSLWVPLRGLFGMLLMLPSPGTGYSLVQMTVVWIVLNGIGAANTVWNTVLDQLARGLPTVGNVNIPILQSTLNLAAQGVLQSSICMSELNALPQLDIKKNYGPIGVNTVFDNYVLSPNANNPTAITQSATINIGVASPGPAVDQNICGSIRISTIIYQADASTSGNAFNLASARQRLQIKINAFLAMFSALSSTASAITACGNSNASCVSTLNPGFMNAAVDAYKSQIVLLAGGVSVPINQSGPYVPGSPNYQTPNAFAGANATGQSAAQNFQQGNISGGAQQAGEAAWQYGSQGAATAGNAISGAATSTGNAFTNAGNAIANAWEQGPTPVAITTNQTTALKAFGWIHAGSYYYALSQQTSQGFDPDALNVATVNGYPTPISADFNSPNAPAAWNQELYTQLLNATNRTTFNTGIQFGMQAGSQDQSYDVGSLPALGSGRASTGNGFMDQIVNAFSSGLRDPIISFFQKSITGQTEDPLVSMGRFGWQLMMAGEALIFSMIALSALIMLGISPGSCLNPLPWSGETLFSQLFLLLFGVLILLWGSGATLGIYLPMVPYIIFTVTAFSWLIAVVEAVVGAPLIALTLIQPSGEELGNIKPALGIIATVFLKPVLMIFGFILAGSVMRAGLTMLNFGFISAINQSVLPTVFNVVATLILLVFVDTMFVNKAFELIHLLPNRVIRFMGVQPDAGGEEKMIGEAKTGFDTGSKATGDVAKGAYESAQKKLAAGDKADKEGGTTWRSGGGVLPHSYGGGKSGGGGGDGKPGGAGGSGGNPAGGGPGGAGAGP